MLEVKDFSKHYGSFKALTIDRWQLDKGLYWITGENGSGKTTLFRSLAGIIPCSGNVTLNQVDLVKQPVLYRKHVNYSEAEPLYPSFLTAHDLITFIAKAKNVGKHSIQHVVETLHVTSYIKQACGTFSSGMLKKLSLSLALVGDPHLLILDEPFITLDIEAQRNLVTLITEHLQRGAIVLVSSHQNFEEYGLTINKTFSIQNRSLV